MRPALPRVGVGRSLKWVLWPLFPDSPRTHRPTPARQESAQHRAFISASSLSYPSLSLPGSSLDRDGSIGPLPKLTPDADYLVSPRTADQAKPALGVANAIPVWEEPRPGSANAQPRTRMRQHASPPVAASGGCARGTTANIICLGGNEVIVERSNQKVTEELTSEGIVVRELDLSEFVKGSGGPNCLILPVERG